MEQKCEFNISGMTCTNCSNSINKVISKQNGVKKVNVSFLNSFGEFLYDDSLISKEQIAQKIEKLGFKVSKSKKELEHEKRKNYTKLKIKLLVASFSLILSFFIHDGFFIFVLASITQFYSGFDFYLHSFKSLKNKQTDMNVLVALGSSVAYIYSSVLLFFPNLLQENLTFSHFHSSIMIICFILIGKFLEEKSKQKANNFFKSLLDLAPQTATLQNGTIVNINELKPLDNILIKAGEKIPTDGVIIDGEGLIDASSLTGESEVLLRGKNDILNAGMICKGGFLTLMVSKKFEDSLLANIISLLSQSQNKKLPISNLANKISNYFVPFVIMIAIITFSIWYFFENNLNLAIILSSSVLLISCPCALGLATPIAIVNALALGAKNNILIKNPIIIESLKDIKYAIFDKTGTLTKGNFKVSKTNIKDKELLQKILNVQEKSEHLLANGIVSYIKNQNLQASKNNFKIQTIMGLGIKAVDEEVLIMGNKELFLQENIKITDDINAIYVGLNGKYKGYFKLEDEIKPQAKEVLSILKKQDIKTIMITGDNEKTANEIAKSLGIKEVYSQVLPAQKFDIMKTFQEKGKVLFIGDGINDALSLKNADVSISFSNGSDLAKESGDIILMNNDLFDILKCINISKQTIKTIKQNLFWAFCYNLFAIPLAAGVFYKSYNLFLTPQFAAIAMSCSSIFVVLNSIRLRNKNIN